MTITALKLYHYPLSRSVRVRFLLQEVVGDNFECYKVKLLQGEALGKEFMRKNPNHAVPILEISYADGTQQTMIESGAMIVWLADAYAEKKLAPPVDALAARADYLQMIFFGCAHMDMSLWQIRLHENLLPKEQRSETYAQFHRKKLEKEMMPQLAARLGKHDFICGDIFSAADCVAVQNIIWARAYDICRTPVFDAYMSRISKREGFIKAFADAKEFEH